MLLFSIVLQAKRVRTESSITKDVWTRNTRRAAVAADHRLLNSMADLELLWKKDSSATAEGASAAQVTEQVEYQAESDH